VLDPLGDFGASVGLYVAERSGNYRLDLAKICA